MSDSEVTADDLTDEMIEAEERRAIKLGDRTFARLCNRALARTVPSALVRIAVAINARNESGTP